jgi:hypothetical protein
MMALRPHAPCRRRRALAAPMRRSCARVPVAIRAIAVRGAVSGAKVTIDYIWAEPRRPPLVGSRSTARTGPGPRRLRPSPAPSQLKLKGERVSHSRNFHFQPMKETICARS